MINKEEVQALLEEILDRLRQEPDPAITFSDCVIVWQLLDDTIRKVGPSGIRGEAARMLIHDAGSAHNAAIRIRSNGGFATAATVKRIASA